VVGNNIYSNSYGIDNVGTSTIDARSNWWGDSRGPTHTSNPSGAGDRVSDKVNFVPWATSPVDLLSERFAGVVFRDIDGNGIFTVGVDQPIAGASVVTQFGDETVSDNSGSYILEHLRPAWGYSLSASAQGFCPKTVDNLEIIKGQVTYANIALNPLSATVPEVNSMVPDPNPQVSTIEKGGSAHRYYMVTDSLSTVPLFNAGVTVEKNGVLYRAFTANEMGEVDISVPSSDIGNGEPGQTESFQIVSVDGSDIPLSERISFSCSVRARESQRIWENNTYGRVGLSHFAIEGGAGTRTSLIEDSGSESVPDHLRIERQGRGGVGLAYGVQAPFQISVNGWGFKAELGAEDLFSIVTDDAYEFPQPIENDVTAEAEFILLTGSKVSILDNVLIRLLTYLQDNLGPSLEEAYISDSKGIDFRGSVGGEALLGYQEGHRVTIEGGLQGGIEAHTTIKSQWLAQESAERFSFGGTISANAGGALEFIDDRPKSLESRLFLDKLGLRALWSGTLGGELAEIVDGTSKQQLALEVGCVRRETFGEDTQEDDTRVTIRGEEALAEFRNVACQAVKSFLSPWGTPVWLTAGPTIFGSILIDGMARVGELQDPNRTPIGVVNSTEVTYEKSRVGYSEKPGFDISIDVALTKTLSAHFGAGAEFREGNGAVVERGELVRGIPYPLETYNEVPEVITTSYEDLWRQIDERIPFSVKAFAFLTNILSFGSLKQSASMVQADTFLVGDCGSKIAFPLGSVPDTVSSITSNCWGWWGGSPCSSALKLSHAQRIRHESIRAEAEQSYNMSYGIGGFYQFEPYGLGLNAPATFVMTYQNEDVVGIDESDLAMYREIKATHEFEFVGGVVDTLHNTVTALVDSLGLFTLAPRLPAGDIILIPTPSVIPSDGISTALITSDTLRNNDGSKVGNGVPYTVSANSGFIMTADADTNLEGCQVQSENSLISFTLRSGPIAFNADISARSVYGSAIGNTLVRFEDNAVPSPPSGLRILHCQSLGQVQAMWSRSPEPDVAGYKIYFDDDKSGPPYTGNVSASGVPSPIDVMGDTSVVIVGLLPNRTYYFAVTTYDIAGNESAYCQENAYPLTGVDDDTSIPRAFSLQTNYPNPFNPRTTIEYSLPEATHVNLSIYDVQGRLICNLVDKVESAGKKRVVWDATSSAGRRVASGVYFYRIVAGTHSESKKMILLR
jgi:hypothetical protein